MKTNFLKKTILCLLLMLLILSSSTVFASNNLVIEPRTAGDNSDEQSNVAAISDVPNNTYISSDLFLYNTNVELSDNVNGNVAIYGQNVNITGEIQGDVLILANSITISEDAMIYGNVFALAPTIKISGVISDVYALCSNFTLDTTGRIARNLNIIAPSATLNGKIGRDVNINTSNLTFPEDLKDAVIGGNLNYWSNTELNIPEGAVSGETKYTAVETKRSTEDVIASAVSSVVKGLVLSFAIIMLSIWISPDFKNRLGTMIKNNSVKCFLIGLLIAFAIIVASIFLLLFTFSLGSTIAVCALGLLILAYAISSTIFAMGIARLITNKLNLTKNTPFVLFALLVVLIISLLKFIPVLGGIVNVVTSLIGLGMLGMNFYKRKTLYTVDDNAE